MGTGILTLLGSNTYSGGTTISAGTLQVGNGGSGAAIGSTSGVLDNGGLVFNHSDIVTFSPLISGSGSLTQTGTGILTLAGQQHVHRRHDDLRRHAAGGQRRQRCCDRQHQQRVRQRQPRFQP